MIVTHSRKGFTDNIAEAITEGVNPEIYLDTKSVIKRVGEIKLQELADADALVFGSPIYLGYLSGELKHLLDNCYYFFKKFNPRNSLARKPAAAFTNGKYKDYNLLKFQFIPQNLKKLEYILFNNLMMRKIVEGAHFATNLENKDPRHPPALTDKQRRTCRKIGSKLADAVSEKRVFNMQ